MNKSIAILLVVLSSTFATASESFVNAQGSVLSRREAIVALAGGSKVFKLSEMTLGDKGTIHAAKASK